jgi:hypothetical protein
MTGRHCVAALVFVACSFRCSGQNPPPYQVYFVSVGSAWYVTPTGKGVHGFSRISGANKSAKIVSDELVSGGAEFGILLTSEEHDLVTVADIDGALKKVGDRILTDKPQRPLFVFYFAGHGLSEGIAWNHFSIPGDFAYRGDAQDLNIEGLSNSTLHTSALVDELQTFHVPFLVLLDNCYDGKEKSFESPILSGTAIRSIADVGGILRRMNEFGDTYPVLFSTIPGSSVVTVDDPREPNSLLTIGPLARRFSLAVSSMLDRGTAVALDKFLGDMTSAELDSHTSPAITHSPIPQGAKAPFLVPHGARHPIEEQQGTGHVMQICCRSTPVLAVSRLTPNRDFTGKLSVAGEPGEYISSGKTLLFSSPSFRVTVAQPSRGYIRIHFERENLEFDASFSTAAGESFTVSEYPSAQRSEMTDAGHPGMEISGDGRGCSDISGSFRVNDVAYDQDGIISKFAATFIQVCDTAKFSARGVVEVRKGQ